MSCSFAGCLEFRKARIIWFSGTGELGQRMEEIILIIIIIIITTSGKLLWLWTPGEASMALRGVRK